MTPQETDPDLPVSVWESLADVWVHGGLLWGQGHWEQQSWEAQHKSSWRSFYYPYDSLT